MFLYQDGEVLGLTFTQYCSRYPDTSFSQDAELPGRYISTSRPEYNPYTHTVREITPVGGFQQWAVESLFSEYVDEHGITHTVQEQEDAAIAAALAAERHSVWNMIKEERERRTQYGGFSVAGKWFHSDTFSRSQQLGLVIMGPNIPAGLMWKTMDGTFVEMTPALAQQLLEAGAASDNTIYQHAETLKAAVYASQEPYTVDITAGWPETFADQ